MSQIARRFESQAAREEALARLPAWKLVEGRDAISRRFVFTDFAAALSFMVRAGLHAERLNHHPEWFNVYSRVDVVLTTHDAGGLSPLDIELATRMDQAAE